MIDEGCKKLEIYRPSHELAIKIHSMTMNLPRFELYEEGSQIRRSAKSVPVNIVEGYCLRKHKNEFLLYLNRAYASAEETIEHLEILIETRSLRDETLYGQLQQSYEQLCKMIFKFIQVVTEDHDRPYYLREDRTLYDASNPNP